MFDNEIMPPSERLKNIRRLHRITQDEIAEGMCTRNNLSLIENNKQKLSFNLAVGIANRINKILQEKGLNVKSITADFLMKDENEQANEVFAKILKELEGMETIDLAEKKLYKAEILLEKYNISDIKKIELYKFMADIYYNKYQYAKSNEMCNTGLKICINSKNIEAEVNMYIYIARNSIKTFHHNEALKELDYAERLNNNICNLEFCELIFYNKGLAYKKLGEYDNALKYLKILKERRIKNQSLLIKARIVYANCLNEQHKFKEAEKEYIETLDLANELGDKDFIALTYKNLSELYLNEKKYKDAAKYIQDSLMCTPSNEYLNEINYFAAKVFQNLNEDVEHYLLRALEICQKKDNENIDLIEKIIYELVLIYMKREDEENIILMTQKVEELNIDWNLIYLELVEYYRERKKEKSEYLNKRLIDKNKQIKKI